MTTVALEQLLETAEYRDLFYSVKRLFHAMKEKFEKRRISSLIKLDAVHKFLIQDEEYRSIFFGYLQSEEPQDALWDADISQVLIEEYGDVPALLRKLGSPSSNMLADYLMHQDIKDHSQYFEIERKIVPIRDGFLACYPEPVPRVTMVYGKTTDLSYFRETYAKNKQQKQLIERACTLPFGRREQFLHCVDTVKVDYSRWKMYLEAR